MSADHWVARVGILNNITTKASRLSIVEGMAFMGLCLCVIINNNRLPAAVAVNHKHVSRLGIVIKA
eukprot:scaffold1367_cov56-Cyclotella_meneghiniana.AAC.12